jgi:hypothetical protein
VSDAAADWRIYMMTRFDIKRSVITINHNRKTNGMTVDEMMENVRALIAKIRSNFNGPILQESGDIVFRTSDGDMLSYDGATNTWK